MNGRHTPRARALEAERARVAPPARGERFSGYGVLSLPFARGDLLALRRFVSSSIGPPYTAVWHRDREGAWTFYVSTEPGLACPRYFGADVDRVVVTDIETTWVGHDELVVSAPAPRIEWGMRLVATPGTRVAGALATLAPGALWRSDRLVHLAGRAAGRALGAGRLSLSGLAPNGQRFALRPRRVWHIEASAALVEGRELGPLDRSGADVLLRDFRLPSTPLFAIGHLDFEG